MERGGDRVGGPVESNPASLHSAAAQEAVQKAKSLRQKKKKQDSADRREVSVSSGNG